MGIFATILKDLQIATKIMALVPIPQIQIFGAIATELEAVVAAAIAALAAAKGKTTAEIVAQLHDLPPLP